MNENVELTSNWTAPLTPKSEIEGGFLLYFLQRNKSQEKITFHIRVITVCCEHSFTSDLYGTVKLFWKTRLTLSSFQPGIFIILPGIYEIIAIKSAAKPSISDDFLKIYWPGNFYWYIWPNQKTSAGICNTPAGTLLCLNFSSTLQDKYKNLKTKHYYVYLLRPFNFSEATHARGAWNEASDLCKSAGGSLPIIRDKEDQEEIMSMLTLSRYIPPIEVLFIGLKLNLSPKVCFYFM